MSCGATLNVNYSTLQMWNNLSLLDIIKMRQIWCMFQHCTWLYLAIPGCTWLYLALPRSAMIYLTTYCHIPPLTGSNASVYNRNNIRIHIRSRKCYSLTSEWRLQWRLSIGETLHWRVRPFRKLSTLWEGVLLLLITFTSFTFTSSTVALHIRVFSGSSTKVVYHWWDI